MADISMDGLASGMATNDIVSQILASQYGGKFEKLESQKDDLSLAKDAWRDVNSRLSKLDSTISDLKFSSTFNSMAVNLSNDETASVTANSAADVNSYDLDVSQLAEANRIASKQMTESYAVDLGGAGNSETISIELKDAAGNNTISGNVMNVEITHGDTLTDIKDAINNATVDHDGDANTDKISIAKASIVDNRLVIESYKTGESSELAFTDSAGGILTNEFGFNLDADGKVTGPADGTIDDPAESGVLQSAQNALFSVNGLGITKESNTDIKDVVENLTINLKEIGSTKIDIAKDTKKATTAIQAFVDQYNSLMSFIDDKSAYNSDTEEASILQGDSTLMRMQMNLRKNVTSKVSNEGTYNQLYAVGIEIDRDGVMSLDSSKLKTALEDNPEAVTKLFNADSEDDGFDGVATRLDDYTDLLLQTNTGVIPKRMDYFSKSIKDIDEQVEDLESSYESERERLSSEFAAMEQMISEMNSQSSWLQSQLSNLSNSSLLNS